MGPNLAQMGTFSYQGADAGRLPADHGPSGTHGLSGRPRQIPSRFGRHGSLAAGKFSLHDRGRGISGRPDDSQMAQGRSLSFLALDMHGPDSLEGRFDGLRLVEAEFGKQTVIELSEQAPRQWLLAKAGI
ncbi:MAG: hypothetical protein HC898_12545 [Phycisphaerales bacterium]|nr:hypothetical protein [Phycisphaerales bacterium]